jgi:hypothetical protein
MPFHFDGMFKTEKCIRADGSEYLVPNPPRFQFSFLSHSTLRKTLTWSIKTPSFDQSVISALPLVTEHPFTAQLCLKYHERWPQEKTRFDPTDVEIENGDQSVCDTLEELLHDRRVCY